MVKTQSYKILRVICIFTCRITFNDSLILDSSLFKTFLSAKQVRELNLCQWKVVFITCKVRQNWIVIGDRLVLVTLIHITICSEQKRLVVVFTAFRYHGITFPRCIPRTKHFVWECLVHQTCFNLCDTFWEIWVKTVSDTWKESIIRKHLDSILVCRYRFLKVFCIETFGGITCLIPFRFSSFVVGTTFKEFSHQFDKMEFWKWTVVPQLSVFFCRFNVLLKFSAFDVGKTELYLCSKDIKIVMVFIFFNKFVGDFLQFILTVQVIQCPNCPI